MLRIGNSFRALAATVMLLGVASACSPRAEVKAPAAGASQPAAARQQKILTAAIEREPPGLQEGVPVNANCQQGGMGQVCHMVHNRLVVKTDTEDWIPQLASEQLSIEQGTWRVNPDGSMVTTWKLRPNVKWHDGAPFTSADLMFAFAVYRDAEIPSAFRSAMRRMVSAEAPDPLTFIVSWSEADIFANQAVGLVPMARHMFEDLYLTDKANFANSARLSSEFIGLGPYRVTHWERGEYLEFAPFGEYYLGPARFDRVIVQIISDPNTMVANILAGAIDVLLPPNGVDLDAAVEVERRWEGTGNQLVVASAGRFQTLSPQHRPEHAQPRNGLTNPMVRQALYQAIDRSALAEVVSQGRSPLADSWIPPNHRLRAELDGSIPKFPYDVARSQQLLASAGWTRRGDGTLVSSTTGEALEIEVSGTSGRREEKEQSVIVDAWKTVGVQSQMYTVPVALARDSQHRLTRPGGVIYGYPYEWLYTDALDSRQVASAENGWRTAANRSGYSNPQVDAILDRLRVTLDPRAQTDLHRKLLSEAMGEVAIMPLYWIVDPFLAVKGVGPIRGREVWNFGEWDKQ